jgi:hypothetical protein
MLTAINPHVSIPGYMNTAENGFIKYQVYDIDGNRIHEPVDFWFVFERTVYTNVNLSFAASMDEKYGGLYWVNNEHRRAFRIWSGGPVHAFHLAYGDKDNCMAYRLFWSVNETRENGAIIYYIEQAYADIKYTASMCFDLQDSMIKTITSGFKKVTFLHTSSMHQTALFVCDLEQEQNYCELYTDIDNTTEVYKPGMTTPISEFHELPYKIPFYKHARDPDNDKKMVLYEHMYNSLVPGVAVYNMTHENTAVYYFMTQYILYVFHYVGYNRLTKPVDGNKYVKSVRVISDPNVPGQFTYEAMEVNKSAFDDSLMKIVGIDHIEAIDLRDFMDDGVDWLGYVDYQTNAYLPNISRILFTYRTRKGEIKLKEIVSNGSIETTRGMKQSKNTDITLSLSPTINLNTSDYTKRHGGVMCHSDKRCYLFIPGKIYIIKSKTTDTVHIRAELVNILNNDYDTNSPRYTYVYNATRDETNTNAKSEELYGQTVAYSVTVVRINACIHTYSTVKNSTCVFCIDTNNEGIEINVENDSILQLQPAILGAAGRVSSHMYSIYCDSNGIYTPFEKAFNVDAELTGKTITEIRDILMDIYTKINDIWYRTQKISYRP